MIHPAVDLSEGFKNRVSKKDCDHTLTCSVDAIMNRLAHNIEYLCIHFS